MYASSFPSLLPVDTVIHGDCTEAIRCLPAGSVDFILTDPPYLVNYRSRDGRGIHVAEYLTTLPPRAVLVDRLHQATQRAQLQIEQRKKGDSNI